MAKRGGKKLTVVGPHLGGKNMEKKAAKKHGTPFKKVGSK